jgi:ATP-dependent DNA ligase
MPFTVPQPMLARLADKLPVGPEWSYEVKWDGYRCLAERSAAYASSCIRVVLRAEGTTRA